MDQDPTVSRRRALRLFVVGAFAAPVLVACTKTLTCDDVSSLPTADATARAAFEYKDAAPDPAKTCTGCVFFVTAGEAACGSCKLVKGPIHPKGTCKSWAAKPPA